MPLACYLWDFPIMAEAQKASGLLGTFAHALACPAWPDISQTTPRLLGSVTSSFWIPSGSLEVTQPKVWGFNVPWDKIWPVRNRRLEGTGGWVILPSSLLTDCSETQNIHTVSLRMCPLWQPESWCVAGSVMYHLICSFLPLQSCFPFLFFPLLLGPCTYASQQCMHIKVSPQALVSRDLELRQFTCPSRDQLLGLRYPDAPAM